MNCLVIKSFLTCIENNSKHENLKRLHTAKYRHILDIKIGVGENLSRMGYVAIYGLYIWWHECVIMI